MSGNKRASGGKRCASWQSRQKEALTELGEQVAKLTQQLDRELGCNKDLRQRIDTLQGAIQHSEKHLQPPPPPGAAEAPGADAASHAPGGGAAAPTVRQRMSTAADEAQRYAENLEYVQSMGMLCPHQYKLLLASTWPTWPAPGSLVERYLQCLDGRAFDSHPTFDSTWAEWVRRTERLAVACVRAQHNPGNEQAASLVQDCAAEAWAFFSCYGEHVQWAQIAAGAALRVEALVGPGTTLEAHVEKAAICLRGLLTPAELAELRVACAAAAENMDRPNAITDMLKRAAVATGPGVAGPSAGASDGCSAGDGAAASTSAAALLDPDPLAVMARTVQLMASAEMERHRLNAAVLLMWLHCMSALSTSTTAAWLVVASPLIVMPRLAVAAIDALAAAATTATDTDATAATTTMDAAAGAPPSPGFSDE